MLEQRGLEAQQGTWSWAVSPGARQFWTGRLRWMVGRQRTKQGFQLRIQHFLWVRLVASPNWDYCKQGGCMKMQYGEMVYWMIVVLQSIWVSCTLGLLSVNIDVQIMKSSLYVQFALLFWNRSLSMEQIFLGSALQWHVILGGQTGAVSTKCWTKVSVCTCVKAARNAAERTQAATSVKGASLLVIFKLLIILLVAFRL